MSSYPSRDEVPKRLGRYELLGQLATGGMAEIHLARLAGEGGFEKIVVVKRLLPELVASPAYVAMFLDEGKLVARLNHPNICEVYELGRDGAEYYLAMPYLDGIAVHELIARPRDPDRMAQLRVAAGVVVQACAGLHHAHELKDADGGPAHLVHRDVSPSNLFVTAAGVVKVLDFGIAKVRGATETEVGTIKGKQQYMAPEQVLGEPLDRRCDVFALGIVLFELATHQRLFKRASDYLTARAVLEEPIPRADAIDPAVPAALADVIAKALARDRAQRHATAAELAVAIEAALPIGTPAELAAAVTSTDELSKLRTRQAKVIGAARSQLGAAHADARGTDTAIDAAPTVAYRRAPSASEADAARSARTRDAGDATQPPGGAVAMGGTTRPGDAARTVDTTTGAANAAGAADAARAAGVAGAADAARTVDTTTGAANTAGAADAARAAGVAGAADAARTVDTTEVMRRPQRGALVVAILGAGALVALAVVVAEMRQAPVTRAGIAYGSAAGVATTPDGAAGVIGPDGGTAGAASGSPDAAANLDGATGVVPAARDAGTDLAAPARDAAPHEIEMPPVDVARPAKPGLLSIDSTPWATVYVDGAPIGITPIVKRSLPAGRHRLRAVLKDGRTKELTIDIPAGRLAKPIQLTW